ncbi:MAG: efflux transporter outer membrane subunit [Bacteroidales bacterium]|nr:efflux transporter outer membrane subunit [Bacteroidales bacterium]
MNKIIVTLILACSTISVVAKTEDLTTWRNVFTDPQLGILIETAMEHNADLLTANLNVEQADAGLRMARLATLPSVAAGVEGSLSKTKGAATTKTYNVPLTLQWEVDLSGRLRREKRAALANYWSMAETERAVRLQLIASVATHYYTLVMMDEQLRVTRQSMNNARQTVEVMEAMKEVGMQNEAAVSQARAAYLNVAASEKSLLQQIKTTENALMVLIGVKYDSISRNRWESTDVCIADTTSYPIERLANRPDVKAAEYALKSQMEQVNVARAAFYPQLTISASAGWTNNVGEIVNPGQILLNAIGSLVQPLFNKGKNRANLRIAKAQQEQALVAFNQSLLVAGSELSDALSACQLSRDRLSIRKQEADEAEQAYEVSKTIMQNSSNTYLEVLTAQSALIQSRLNIISDWLDNIQGKINLFKALGGDIR